MAEIKSMTQQLRKFQAQQRKNQQVKGLMSLRE